MELYKDRITVKPSQEFELLSKELLSSNVFKDGVLNQLHLEPSSCQLMHFVFHEENLSLWHAIDSYYAIKDVS